MCSRDHGERARWHRCVRKTLSTQTWRFWEHEFFLIKGTHPGNDTHSVNVWHLREKLLLTIKCHNFSIWRSSGPPDSIQYFQTRSISTQYGASSDPARKVATTFWLTFWQESAIKCRSDAHLAHLTVFSIFERFDLDPQLGFERPGEKSGDFPPQNVTLIALRAPRVL